MRGISHETEVLGSGRPPDAGTPFGRRFPVLLPATCAAVAEALAEAPMRTVLAPVFAVAFSLALAVPARADDDCHHPETAEAPAEAGKHPAHAAHAHKSERPGDKADKAATSAEGWVLTRGEKLQGAPELSLAKLLENPAPQDGKVLRIDGTVRQACSSKGCWMELATDAKGPGVRVTFKDYGFFVPVDSAGSQARVEGVVKVAELSEGTAKHYTSEGAIVPRGPDGKPREVQLIASGVELRR